MSTVHPAPAPDGVPELVAAVAAALAAGAGTGWTRLVAEWSQAGVQHSGRLLVTTPDGVRRESVPPAAVDALAELRRRTADPVRGAWLSARVEVEPGQAPRYEPNHDRRPLWTSSGVSMLDDDATTGPPVPDDARWLADLRRYPRDRAHVPTWLVPDAVDGEETARLRAALDSSGMPPGAVLLPGEDPDRAFEGTVELVHHGPGHWAVRVDDYGQHQHLGDHRTERDACLALWQYVSSPLPTALRMPLAEVQQRAATAAPAFGQLGERLGNVGLGGMITNLAVGVPFDRFGGLDGLYFFGWGTPWEQRSLPPTANQPGGRFVTLMALQPVEVQAEVVPPWFDQPGGGIRFHVEGRARGVRDLVREQLLAVVDVV